MATPPTFTVGQILTASQMNAVGLWRINGASFTGATTFDVTGFTSDYSLYRLIIRTRRVDTAGAGTLIAQVRNGSTPITTGYYQGSAKFTYAGVITSEYLRNSGSNFLLASSDSFTTNSFYAYDITSTNSAGFSFTGNGYYAGAAYSLSNAGAVAATTAPDNIRCSYDYGTHTGLWELYGYRQ